MTRALTIALVALGLFAGTAAAKEGYYIGAYYPNSSISKDIDWLERGGGFGGRIGKRLDRHFAVELTFFETNHDTAGNQEWELEGGTFDIKFHMPIGGVPFFEPFVSGGFGKYALETPTRTYRGNVNTVYRNTEPDGSVNDLVMSFPNGYQFGVGSSFYVGQDFSVDIAYVVRKMYFDYGTPGDEELRARVRSFEAGVSYHF